MSSKKSVIWKNSMNYGAVVGVVLVIVMLLAYMLDAKQDAWYISLINYTVIVAGIIVGTKNIRDKEQAGLISYGRCLGSGTLISAFAGIILALYTFVFYKFIDPDAMERILLMIEDSYLQMGIPDDQVEMTMNMVRKVTNPAMMAINTVFVYGFMGFLLSLITGIFLKKKQGTAFTQVMDEVEEYNPENKE